MAVKIRLRRMGSKKNPYYRVIVADSRAPRNGRFIEEIGFYNPLSVPKSCKIDPERVQYWIGVGAKPTDTVNYLLKEYNIYSKEAKTEAVEEVETEAVENVEE
ncbi:MAG: 30S ribosomal protein S16 [Ezakiella sp.]|nr:30S ribosomal protein S16 [Ezakiella sp.]MDD7762109.1 30S ribosomal protein S16 [Bacillota bacterium]MDY3947040.1 30S ribosomal protein S16 [Ezakiella sp.]